MVYFANWGTHRFMFRMPADLVDAQAIKPYCCGSAVEMRRAGEYLLIHLTSEDESGDWDDEGGGSSPMASLAPVRAEVLAGDLRPLYLAWLMAVQDKKPGAKALEPPVPPGLKQLTGPQQALVDYLRVDDDLLAAAAERSPSLPTRSTDERDLAAWVASLPVDEKDALLLSVAQGEAAGVQMRMQHRFLAAQARAGKVAAPAATGRTVRELREAAWQRTQQRAQEEARRRAEEKARREAEAAAARERHLKSLVGKEATLWRQVEEAVATRQPRGYQEAATLLQDLRDVAQRTGSAGRFAAQLDDLRARHAKKGNFLRLIAKLDADLKESAR